MQVAFTWIQIFTLSGLLSLVLTLHKLKQINLQISNCSHSLMCIHLGSMDVSHKSLFKTLFLKALVVFRGS